jgi:hypothetical protein
MQRADWEEASYAEKLGFLDERLRRVQKIADFSDPEHDEANAVAFALVEIGEGVREILAWSDRLRTFDQMSDSEIIDSLWDLGDMLRHLLGHARHPRFFAVYLDEPR